MIQTYEQPECLSTVEQIIVPFVLNGVLYSNEKEWAAADKHYWPKRTSHNALYTIALK